MTGKSHSVLAEQDISYFLEATNGLNDGCLTGVQFLHRGHTPGNPHTIDPSLSELRIRYMVCSLRDSLVELVFSAPSEWQIKESPFTLGIEDTATLHLTEDGKILWADGPDATEGCYVIAQAMQWRFVTE